MVPSTKLSSVGRAGGNSPPTSAHLGAGRAPPVHVEGTTMLYATQVWQPDWGSGETLPNCLDSANQGLLFCQETKPRAPQAQTAEEKCLQKVRDHVFSSLKLVEPFCCIAQSRMAQSDHAGHGAGPVSASFWIQWWQQEHCGNACSQDNRWVKRRRFLWRGGPSVGKTCTRRWSSASSLSVKGTLRVCPPLSLP